MKSFKHIIGIIVLFCMFSGCSDVPETFNLKPELYHQLELPPEVGPVSSEVESIKNDKSKYTRPTNRNWKYIIIHHSASDSGNVKIFEKWHLAKDFDELGYHFVITNGRGGNDGEIHVGSRWKKQKWGAHAGRTKDNEYNNYGIGICLVGNFMDHNPTKEQLESLKQLIITLSQRYGIKTENIITHRDVPGATTSCPGDYFYKWLQTKKWHQAITVSLN